MSKKIPAVRVAPAAFGMGVYAKKQFRRGQLIGEVDGTIVHDDQYTSRYCMELGSGQTMEPGDPFRFINHSCDPNAELMYYDPETLKPEQKHLLNRLFVQARRTIRDGEELSIDYCWPADHAIPCGCGARNCRKWIVDPDELHLVESGEVEFVSLPG